MRRGAWFVVGGASFALACSGSSTSSGFGGGDAGGDSPSFVGGGDGGMMLGTGGDGSTGMQPPGCSQAAMLIYVIDDLGGLHSFDPASLTFKTIGTISCPGVTMYNSMAVDRTATAWVNDTQGHIFKVSTSTASCQTTSFSAPAGFNQMGMGFSTDMAGGTTEKLFVDGLGGTGLAKVDLTTMALTMIGPFGGTLSGNDCELTGTGNAELYGFFTTMPASVAKIDKSNAQILSNVPQNGVNTGTDWAFSFWGGDFYLYTADTTLNPGDTTNVTRYRPSDGSTTVVLMQIGFRIVGAGVSTCAPTQPPK